MTGNGSTTSWRHAPSRSSPLPSPLHLQIRGGRGTGPLLRAQPAIPLGASPAARQEILHDGSFLLMALITLGGAAHTTALCDSTVRAVQGKCHMLIPRKMLISKMLLFRSMISWGLVAAGYGFRRVFVPFIH